MQDVSSSAGEGTKIPHAPRHGQEINKLSDNKLLIYIILFLKKKAHLAIKPPMVLRNYGAHKYFKKKCNWLSAKLGTDRVLMES